MAKRIDPRIYPDFSNVRVVDSHMERLDTHGVSRRDFLSLASAGVVAAATASAYGLSNAAVAAPSGKLAFLTAFYRNEYNVIAHEAFTRSAKSFDLNYTVLDGQFDSQLQLSQFEQQSSANVTSAVFNLADGASIKRIAQIAQQNRIYVANVWDTLAWFTPFEAGDYYTLYAVPEEFDAHRGVTVELLKTITETHGGGDVIGVTGQPGNWTDIARSRGRDDAFKDFPKTRLAGELPGRWNREDALKATEDLLTRNKKVVGVVAQNDDVAQGALGAIRAAGLKPGEDIFVVGADGTALGAKSIAQGHQLATSANSPAYVAGLFTARVYDVTHGWTPRASERLLNWRSMTATKANISGYIERFVDNGGVEPFDVRKLSRVLHPNDWDPQVDLYPLDIEKHWTGIPKPAGWSAPKPYADAWANGEAEAVKAEYAAHYKIRFDGPSPNRKA